jgi:hypothetical protein
MRFSPPVGPLEKTREDRAAEDLLGIELGPGGLWVRPQAAAAYWLWLRDHQPPLGPCLDDLLSWLTRFLGLSDRPQEASRFFALGFVQGAEMSLHGKALPTTLLEPVPDALLARGTTNQKTLDSVAGPAPLSRLRNWASQWLTSGFMEPPTIVWRLGLSMGYGATRTHPLVCGMLTAEIDCSRFEQRFAGRALVATNTNRSEQLWPAFIRSTYGQPIEGGVLSAAATMSLARVRETQGTLQAFLMDAVVRGRSFAKSSCRQVDALLDETGSDHLCLLRRFYVENSGPLTLAAPVGPLLTSLRLWVFRCHPNLFTANDPGAEHVTLRNAYDYLWWRGFLESASAC